MAFDTTPLGGFVIGRKQTKISDVGIIFVIAFWRIGLGCWQIGDDKRFDISVLKASRETLWTKLWKYSQKS
jgi:hypothetical protein